MAERRMFAKAITESAAFMDMPMSSQCLYFHLGMAARDRGIVVNAKAIASMIGATESDISLLVDRGFLVVMFYNDFPAFRIVHWYENNGIGETAKKRNNYTYRQWRKAVIERDGKCKMCGAVDNLHAHHIRPFSQYPESSFDIENGLTLCHACHRKVHKEMKEWQKKTRNTFG